MAADTAIPAIAAPPTDRQPSPTTIDSARLSSNNPFRNRLSVQPTSPSMQAATPQSSLPSAAPGASKNPFLDPSSEPRKTSPPRDLNSSKSKEVDEVFKGLSMNTSSKKPAFSNGPVPQRGPLGLPGSSQPRYRPLAGEERRERRDPPPYTATSPAKRPEHRRRASESSTMDVERRDRRERQMDRGERPPRTESEERRRRERRKEREERHRREKERIANGGEPRKPKRPFRNLDLIDKLDVTGVYGQGLFHHDGPFDACRPNRNARKDRKAPLQAFPEGSMNMAIGGSGPNRSRLDLDQFHGRTEEGFADFNKTRKEDTAYQERQQYRPEPFSYVNPTDRTEQVHGEESYGLGTSTFLEGAPASRRALQRRESEEQANGFDGSFGGGLARKKSLAQRIRGMSAPRPRGTVPEGMRSPDARYNPGTPIELSDAGPAQQQQQAVAQTAAGADKGAYTKENEINPYDEAFEKKGTEIKFAEQDKPSSMDRARAVPGSPSANALSRSVTADAAIASPGEEKPVVGGGGFLNRMKSLKGGRRARPERKDSNP